MPNSTLSTCLRRLNSNTLQTALMVIFIVAASVGLSVWLFWRSLYLPELKNHATYIAGELQLIERIRQEYGSNSDLQAWLSTNTPLQIVENPSEFPNVTDKVVADFFTDILATEASQALGRPVYVYFKFKPTPMLWVQDSQNPDIWLQEPVVHYSQYSPALLALFLLGLPLMTLAIIFLLVRALNRPLKRLEKVASDYILTGSATHLPTNLGSNEIRQVNTAFNHLFHTLHAAQKERTIMLAGISHDLRTPLTRMRLIAEMMDDDFVKEGLIYDIEDMDAILEQFISFMKDGSDESIRPTDLDSICREIMVQFQEVCFIYHKEITGDILLRPLSIKRLIVNLVNNAVRYGLEPIHLVCQMLSKEALPISVPSHDFGDELLLICVKDEGAGIDESQLERIMQPFERGETARTTQGSGLGLAIVARIAKLHNGIVQIINHPAGGLQVCVYIPLIDAPSDT